MKVYQFKRILLDVKSTMLCDIVSSAPNWNTASPAQKNKRHNNRFDRVAGFKESL